MVLPSFRLRCPGWRGFLLCVLDVVVDVVEVGGRVVMDAVLGTTRYARIDLLDFPPGGTVIRFHADQLPEYPEGIDIYVEYAAENSNRLLPHYFGLDGNGFELVD